MESAVSILTQYLIPFIFVLGLLVFFHEFGHFIMAKLVGIRVERFSLGLPPRLIGKKIGDTDYCISATPFGGYVKMSGMIDESMDKESIKGEPYEFMSKPVWARALVIAAGPLFNVLLTVLIFAVTFMSLGIAEPVDPTPTVIGAVMSDRPADRIGLKAGDKITHINTQPVTEWGEIVKIINAAPGQELFLEWERNGEKFSASVTPEYDKILDIGLIGIEPLTVNRRAGIFEAFGLGFERAWYFTKLLGRSIGLMFAGEASFREDLAGPVRIAQMAGDSAKSGFLSLMGFAAFLSLNLGLLNILPLPVLDGGHLVMLGIEGTIRRPLSVKFKLIVQQVGMALLLALMLFVIFNDFSNLFK